MLIHDLILFQLSLFKFCLCSSDRTEACTAASKTPIMVKTPPIIAQTDVTKCTKLR